LLYRLACDTIKNFGNNAILCEIGSFRGKSTVSIAMALKTSQGGHLYAIDWHQGSPGFSNYGTDAYHMNYEEYKQNLKKYEVESWVTTIKLKSQDALDKVPDTVHFLWIDGAHGYDDVKSDYENYHPKIVDGGYLLFHDAVWSKFREPLELICDEVLYNESYNLYAIVENILVFKKEKNKTWKLSQKLLQNICLFVARSERPFYKRCLSAVLRIVTSWFSWHLIIDRSKKDGG